MYEYLKLKIIRWRNLKNEQEEVEKTTVEINSKFNNCKKKRGKRGKENLREKENLLVKDIRQETREKGIKKERRGRS